MMDLTPILDRIAQAEQQLATLQARRDLEPDSSPLIDEIIHLTSETLVDLRDHLASAAIQSADNPQAQAEADSKLLQQIGIELQKNNSASLGLLDATFHFIEVNQVFIDRSGLTRDQIVGKGYFTLFPRSRNRFVYERVRNTRVVEHYYMTAYENPYAPGQGTRYYDWSVAAVQNVRGDFLGLLISSADSSEDAVKTQVAANAIRDLRAIVGPAITLTEGAPEAPTQVSDASSLCMSDEDASRYFSHVGRALLDDPNVALVYLDTEQRIIAINAKFVALGGYERPPKPGDKYADIYIRTRLKDALTSVLATGVTKVFRHIPLRLPDQPNQAELIVDYTISPIRDANASIEGCVITVIDRTQIEVERQEHEKRVEVLAELVHASHELQAQTSIQGIIRCAGEYASRLTDGLLSICGCNQPENELYVYSRAVPDEDFPEVSQEQAAAAFANAMEQLQQDRQPGYMPARELSLVKPFDLRPWRNPDSGALFAPLQVHDRQLVGALIVTERLLGSFTPADVQILGQLAAMTSLAWEQRVANQMAARQAAILQAVFDAMDDMVVIGDAQANTTYNRAISQYIGLDNAPTEKGAVPNLVQSRHENGQRFTFSEMPFYRAMLGERVKNVIGIVDDYTGVPHTISINASPLILNGQISGAVSVWHDITDREQAQRQLAAERERQMGTLEKMLAISQCMLAQESLEGVLRCAAESAVSLTAARQSVCLGLYQEKLVRASLYQADWSADMKREHDDLVNGLEHDFPGFMKDPKPYQYSADKLNQVLAKEGLPAFSNPMSGAVAVPLYGRQGGAFGILLVADRAQADFTSEDITLLNQLATITSLAWEHQVAVRLASKRAADLQAVFDAMVDSVAITDIHGNTYYNLAVSELTGAPMDGVDMGDIPVVLHSRDESGRTYAREELPYWRALQGEEVRDFIAVVDDFKGSAHLLSVNSSPLYTENEITGAVSVWHDITLINTMQRQLLGEGERRMATLTALLEISQKMMAQTTLDGVLRCLTESACSMTGGNAGATLLRFPERDIYACKVAPDGELSEDISPSDAELVCQAVADKFKAGDALLRLTAAEFTELLAGFGLPPIANRECGLLAAALLDDKGTLNGVVVTAGRPSGDFTPENETTLLQLSFLASLSLEQQQAKRRAQLEADEISSIFNSLTESVIVFDSDARPIRYNKCALDLFGPDAGTRSDAQLSRQLSYRHADGRPFTPEEQPLFRALRGESVIDEVQVLTNYLGEDHVLLANITPQFEGNQVREVIAVAHDITHYDQQQRQLAAERDQQASAWRSLAELSQLMLAQTSIAGVLDIAIKGACNLSTGRISIAGYKVPDNDLVGCRLQPEGTIVEYHYTDEQQKGLYTSFDAILQTNKKLVHLEPKELHALLTGIKMPLPPNRACGALVMPFNDSDGNIVGLVVVVDKERGDFTPDDEIALNQMALIGSLALMQQEARQLASRQAANLRAIFDVLAEAVIVCDLEGNTTSCNQSAINMAGPEVLHLKRTEVARLRSFRTEDGRLCEPDDLPVNRALRGEKVYNQVIVFDDVHGAEHTTLMTAEPYDIDGHAVGAVTVWHDITTRNRAQRELALLQERQLATLRNLMQISQEMMAKNTVESALSCAARGACTLTGGRVGFSGFRYPDNELQASTATNGGDGTVELNPEMVSLGYNQTLSWLKQHPAITYVSTPEVAAKLTQLGLPSLRNQSSGLLVVPIEDDKGIIAGLILVSDKTSGDFTREDESALHQLALLTSLNLKQQLAARQAKKTADDISTVLNGLSEAVLVCDANMKTTLYNQAAVEFYGSEILTKPRTDMARLLSFRHENDAPYLPEELPVYRALHGHAVHDELNYYTRIDGQERAVLTTTTPLYDGEQITGAVAVWHDITLRMLAQRQLEEERLRLAAVIETAPVGITVMDEFENTILSNPTAQRIYGRQVAAGESVFRVLEHTYHYPDGREYSHADLPIIRALQKRETVRDVELRVMWEDGRELYLLCNAAPLEMGEASQRAAIIIFQDVTHSRQISEAFKRRVRDMRLLNLISRELNSTHERQSVLDGVLNSIYQITSGTGTGIWLWDEENRKRLKCEACYALSWQHSPLGEHVYPDTPVWTRMLVEGKSITANELDDEPELAPYVRTWLGINNGSLLGLPIKLHDRILGVALVASEKPRRFSTYHRMLLETLLAAGAVALENTELLTVAQRTAAAAERERLARELHDAVSQTLFSASLISESLPRLAERNPDAILPGLKQLHLLTRSAMAEMRSLLLELRPNALLEFRLADLIIQLADTIAGRAKLAVELEIDKSCAVPPDVKLGLYRITQEALSNIIKHARATKIIISLQSLGNGLELSVRDDGRGFEMGSVGPGHFGLDIMRERSAALGLQMNVSSQPGHGTVIRVRYTPSGMSEEAT
ncbi:MAG: PAS domain S-box protein [Anaerolineae bacterium]